MPKTVSVNIIAETDAKSGDGYHVYMDGYPNNSITFNKDADNLPKSDHYKIEFNLVNKQGCNLKFADKENAMWVCKVNKASDPCPSSPSDVGNEFTVLKRDSDIQLTVKNKDSNCELLAFRLNLLPHIMPDSGNPADYIPCDPISDNRNGGSGRSFAADIAVAAGGALIGAVVVLIAMPHAKAPAIIGAAIGGALLALALALGIRSLGERRSA